MKEQMKYSENEEGITMLNIGMYKHNWYFVYQGIDYRICHIKAKWQLFKAAKKIGNWDLVIDKEYETPYECFACNFDLGEDYEYKG